MHGHGGSPEREAHVVLVPVLSHLLQRAYRSRAAAVAGPAPQVSHRRRSGDHEPEVHIIDEVAPGYRSESTYSMVYAAPHISEGWTRFTESGRIAGSIEVDETYLGRKRSNVSTS